MRLQRAVALPRQPATSRSVVLVTDGYINAEADVFDYIREQRDDLNVFAFGIGSSVNRLLIEGVARAGLGEPFVVTGPGEAPDAASRFRRYIDSPVLTGIDVKFQGFDVYDVEPGTVPDLFASRPIVVFGKWRGTAAGSIEISGNTGRGPYQASVAVSPANLNESHAALRHLWARNRIAELSDFGPGAPDEERVAAITSLGLTYGLLTRYTSFIAVQEIVRNTRTRPPMSISHCRCQRACRISRSASPADPNRRCCGVVAIATALLACAPAADATPAVRRVVMKTRLVVRGRYRADRLGIEAPLRRRARGRSVVDPGADGATRRRDHRRRPSRCSPVRAISRANGCS